MEIGTPCGAIDVVTLARARTLGAGVAHPAPPWRHPPHLRPAALLLGPGMFFGWVRAE